MLSRADPNASKLRSFYVSMVIDVQISIGMLWFFIITYALPQKIPNKNPHT